MNRSLVLLSLLVGGLLLWDAPGSWVSRDLGVAPAYAVDAGQSMHGLPGGLTIGGPGTFDGNDNDSETIHGQSDRERTLCLTMKGKKGTTEATFFPGGTPLQVVKDETTSVCKANIDTIDLRCIGKCTVEWRVDTVGAQGPEGVRRTGQRARPASRPRLRRHHTPATHPHVGHGIRHIRGLAGRDDVPRGQPSRPRRHA